MKLRNTLAALAFSLISGVIASNAAEAKTFKVGYNIYVSFMPFQYMEDHGILKKWADKYGVDIDVMQINDYVAGMNQFVAGDLDAMTGNPMDAMTTPAAGGVDTSFALSIGYSNGNDGMISKDLKSVKELKGQTIYLYELTISHYLLSRALSLNGLSLRDVKTVNVSDTDIGPGWMTTDKIKTAVSWNPMLLQMERGVAGTTRLFDSSNIPGEIADGMFFHTETLKSDPNFMKALTGAWYEAMAIMEKGDATSDKMIEELASTAGSTTEEYRSQLKSTHLFYKPKEAADFFVSDTLVSTLDFIRTFSFDNGLFGQSAKDKDFIGIEAANGKVLGKPDNIKLRMNDSFVKMAADGKL